jgi:hypothetical protein
MVERALTAGVDPASPPRGESSRLRFTRRPFARGQGERGTAVVEFALVAPILFLLVFGIVDFARMMNYYNVMTQLAAQGARAAAVNRNPDGSAVTGPTSIQQMLVCDDTAPGEMRNDSTYKISINNVPVATGDAVTVQTQFDFDFIPFIANAIGLSGKKHLTATSTMRAEVLPSYGAATYTGGSCPP